MYHATYYFQTPSGIVQETVNRKGQARICDDFNFGIQYDTSRDASSTYVSQKMEPWTRSLLRRIEGASEAVFNAPHLEDQHFLVTQAVCASCNLIALSCFDPLNLGHLV